MDVFFVRYWFIISSANYMSWTKVMSFVTIYTTLSPLQYTIDFKRYKKQDLQHIMISIKHHKISKHLNCPALTQIYYTYFSQRWNIILRLKLSLTSSNKVLSMLKEVCTHLTLRNNRLQSIFIIYKSFKRAQTGCWG